MKGLTDEAQPAVPKAPVTGVVVSFNEADLLERCLPSLSFCDEVLVVNMECTDATPEVTARHGARMVEHHRVPTVELVLEWASTQARNDWILSIDPDEVVDPKLGRQITELVAGPEEPRLARVELPCYSTSKTTP